jgi:transposase
MEKSKGRSGDKVGFRVFKIHVSNENLEKLRELYRDFVQGKTKTKTMAYYRKQWIKEWENVLKMRNKKRTLPNPPALLLPIRFILPSSENRGATFAPAIIDLRKGELRIPSYEVRVKLPQKLVEAVTEENSLIPRPEFILQVTRRGYLRLIAHREPQVKFKIPLRIIAIDENSFYGFTLAVFDFERKWKLTRFEIYKPRNQTYLERVVALLRSYADKPSSEKLDELNKLKNLHITTERAYELARRTLHKKRKMNDEFIRRVIRDLRKIIREAREQNMHTVIVIDPINPNSIKNTSLQRTLLRTRKFIRNLAYYEGAQYKELRSSGKMCPICGRWGEQIGPRTYRCPTCNITWDRDRGTVARLPIVYFAYLNNKFREKCDDESAIPRLLQEKYLGFIKRHLGFLRK